MDNLINNLIDLAFTEDIGEGDHTTLCSIPENAIGKASLVIKEAGILAGVDVAIKVFHKLNSQLKIDVLIKDGSSVNPGDIVFTVEGKVQSILQAERIMLNIMQRMSGVATATNRYVALIAGTGAKVLDTRKTTPNMRPFEKYAVKVGGGTNHRYNLSDGVLIKDNHIGAAGSITNAIKLCKEYAPFVRKIEVEVENLEMLKEALEAGADIIMLDNMDNDTMRKAVLMVDGKAETECSGNVVKERLKEIAEIGVDFVSCGALTHSAPIMDLSLKNLVPVSK